LGPLFEKAEKVADKPHTAAAQLTAPGKHLFPGHEDIKGCPRDAEDFGSPFDVNGSVYDRGNFDKT
jgi:hypothetical protein